MALMAMDMGGDYICIARAEAIFTALTSTAKAPPPGIGRVASGGLNLKLLTKGRPPSLGVDGCSFPFL